jgi:superfamily II DNA or RNA helicase
MNTKKQTQNNHNDIIDMPKNLNTYLGQKGYTILKNELSVKQQYFIRDDLTIKPYVPGSPLTNTKTFPAFRESDKKLYVPRYYGEKLFGIPKDTKISQGVDINVPFCGSLRDYQELIVSSYMSNVASKDNGGGLIEIGCGKGKTVCALNIISQVKKKTLVIVHKEFLMNQWIERIVQYLPSAKVGKIQGQVIDIENKDIVIGMLQSLSMKDYPSTIFDTFGLTIIDEVHHISSEVFSCALFKLVTKYMLGLSATMNRKDGTTKVFKMFLGDVIYKDLEKSSYDVVVRGITYVNNNDDEYNSMEFDFRGNPALSKMISKITTYNKRTEFILTILQDMLKENPKQQIMMISQYKNILKYLYDAIKHRNIAEVGYYIGGMKEKLLKESETKQVVLSTYSMAAEGLDIKSLTTLFMVTPMTNIEQSVGRILRQKHEFNPIVVDIIDTHENFQKQWYKRKRFYKSYNYQIIQINSIDYSPDVCKWVITNKTKNNIKHNSKLTNNLNITNNNKSSLSNRSSSSRSSTERSIVYDSENEDNEYEIDDDVINSNKKEIVGKCLLKIKK